MRGTVVVLCVRLLPAANSDFLEGGFKYSPCVKFYKPCPLYSETMPILRETTSPMTPFFLNEFSAKAC